MISADDYVVQLIQDRELVAPDIVDIARQDVLGQGIRETDDDSAILNLLVEKGYTDWNAISAALAAEFDMETADLSQVRPTDEALKLVGQDAATRYNVLPLQMEGSDLLVVIADPLDMDSMDELSKLVGKTLNFKVAPPEEIREAIVAASDNSGDAGSSMRLS